MAAGPGTGSASPWTHIQLDTELSGSWPRRAVLAPCVQEVLVASAEVLLLQEPWPCWWLLLMGQMVRHQSTCPSSTTCHVVRHNAEELNSNFPVSLHFLFFSNLRVPRGSVSITSS